jgi:predicted Rossmann fold flavoprotein
VSANNPRKNLIVIGGGAAGIFCAVNAARLMHEADSSGAPGGRVLVLEKTGKLLSKVKVSGGGRCNVTHACYAIDEMIKKYPRGGNFLKKAFYKWFTTDTIQWFADRGVELKTEGDGRMFPVSDSSQTIIDCLMREANKFGVEIWTMAEVKEVLAPAAGGGGDAAAVGSGFRVRLADSRVLEADRVCIACGGYPKAGMFEWVEKLGHSVEPPVPSLFTFNMPGNKVTSLMGVTIPDVQVKIVGLRGGSRAGLVERGSLLITHWGMSGPVILRLSAWGARELAGGNAGYEFTILVNWVPDYSETTIRAKLQELRMELAAQKISARNPFGLPQRLWEFILKESGIADVMRWADLPGREQNKLVKNLCVAEFAVKGKTTFKEEFVTAGGVRLAEVDPLTMQSRKVPGLFFAGEILDVDGVTGGFNFQHAWTSGRIAAEGVTGGRGASV